MLANKHHKHSSVDAFSLPDRIFFRQRKPFSKVTGNIHNTFVYLLNRFCRLKLERFVFSFVRGTVWVKWIPVLFCRIKYEALWLCDNPISDIMMTGWKRHKEIAQRENSQILLTLYARTQAGHSYFLYSRISVLISAIFHFYSSNLSFFYFNTCDHGPELPENYACSWYLNVHMGSFSWILKPITVRW